MLIFKKYLNPSRRAIEMLRVPSLPFICKFDMVLHERPLGNSLKMCRLSIASCIWRIVFLTFWFYYMTDSKIMCLDKKNNCVFIRLMI